MPDKFQFMCLDLNRAAFLCWSCAHARALQEQTRLEWEPYRSSKALNAIYGVLFWKEGPGTVEIQQDQRKIDILTERYFNDTFDAFLQKSFSLGPAGLAHYAEGLISTRNYGLNAVQQIFRDASSINESIADQAHRTIRTLAAIRLGSALVLTGTGCTVTLAGGSAALAMQIGVVKLGADVMGQIIKPHDRISGNVKGIAYESGKFGAETIADKMAENTGEIARHGLGKAGAKLAFAQQRIQHYSRELARRFQSRKALKIGRRLENAKSDAAIARRTIRTSGRTLKAAKIAGKAVPLVFAAWDVIDAWSEYEGETGE